MAFFQVQRLEYSRFALNLTTASISYLVSSYAVQKNPTLLLKSIDIIEPLCYTYMYGSIYA